MPRITIAFPSLIADCWIVFKKLLNAVLAFKNIFPSQDTCTFFTIESYLHFPVFFLKRFVNYSRKITVMPQLQSKSNDFNYYVSLFF